MYDFNPESFCIVNLGCKVNRVEGDAVMAALMKRGAQATEQECADLIVINTCTVTAEADKKARKACRHALASNPLATVVVTGCAVAVNPDAFASIDPRILVVDRLDLAHSLDAGASDALRMGDGFRTRVNIKIQDGCDHACTYCIVHVARGKARSMPAAEVIAEAQKYFAAGVKEVVLTGVNTGDFGRTTGESFLDLLKALNEVDGIERFRISSIEPNLITPEIIDWIASGTKFQRHFHIPLQSGSDTLLRRVGRRYDTALFASRIDYIRKALERPGEPLVFFGIDVIVGLPSETEELFMETYNFLKDRIRPAFIHVFPYSRRPGTRAAEWKDQVQDSLKTERVARLEALSEQLHAEFVAANKGIAETVLWESSVKNGLMGGYTGNYIRVEKPYDPASVNQLEEIVL